MRCDNAQNQIADATRGALPASAQAALDEHLAACAACAAEMAIVRRGWSALDGDRALAPPAWMKDAVLARVNVAATPLRFTARALVPAVAAALASVGLLVAADSDCRTPLAVACCGTLWTGLFGLAFAALLASGRATAAHVLARRGLLAGAGAILLAATCPTEPGQGLLALPGLSTLALAAAASPIAAFAFGLVVVLVPLVIASFFARPRGAVSMRHSVAGTALYLAVAAPALFLTSSALALGGLVALSLGAAVGAGAPALLESLWLRRRAPGVAA